MLFIHLTAILTIWLAMYLPGIDMILAVIYLIIVWQEGIANSVVLNWKQHAIVGIMWQLPAMIFIFSILIDLENILGFSLYSIFLLELWETPILPLLTILPQNTALAMPLYYYLLYIMIPVLCGIYFLPAVLKKSTEKNLNPLTQF